MKRFLSIAGMMAFVLQVPHAHAQDDIITRMDAAIPAAMAAGNAASAPFEAEAKSALQRGDTAAAGVAVRDGMYAASLAATIAVRASYQPVPTQDTILLNQQSTIAYAAAKAAGRAAYGSFTEPIPAAAIVAAAIAASNAGCLAISMKPEDCSILTQLYIQLLK